MARSRKIRRACAPETPIVWTLPADLLLDIVARFDLRTLIRCAATCQLLRRDLLSPPFVRRVSQAALCIHANLCTEVEQPLMLVHPPTVDASSFCHNHLSPFLSRKGVGILLDEYKPVSSRRGLVILRRQIKNTRRQPKPDNRFQLCVYDPMSGAQTFFSKPPKMSSAFPHFDQNYVILTAGDGIGTSFRLLVFDLCGCNITVNTGLSCGTWGPVKSVSINNFPCRSVKKRAEPAILCGGVIHWLANLGDKIISYDSGTGKTGSVKLPPTTCNVDQDENQLYLATSSDGKRLKLLVIQGFKMFVWLSSAGRRRWSLQTVIDMEKKMRLLDSGGPDVSIEFEGSGTRTGDVVFLNVIQRRGDWCTLIVFDLGTTEIHRQREGLSLVEIDIPSRLQSMKKFS